MMETSILADAPFYRQDCLYKIHGCIRSLVG
jgi:hypothetical protein